MPAKLNYQVFVLYSEYFCSDRTQVTFQRIFLIIIFAERITKTFSAKMSKGGFGRCSLPWKTILLIYKRIQISSVIPTKQTRRFRMFYAGYFAAGKTAKVTPNRFRIPNRELFHTISFCRTKQFKTAWLKSAE